MIKVNPEKWEEIEYKDIRKGDRIRIIVVQGKTVNDARGTVKTNNSYGGWYSKDSVKIVGAPENFHPAAGGHRTIYRRKEQRKVIHSFPENLGAVIEGIDRGTGEKKRFVWDNKDWSDGVHMFYNHISLKERYHSFILLSEGVK